MTDTVDRSAKIAREGEMRLAVKRLMRAAGSHEIEVHVQRKDLELLLAVLSARAAA